MDGTCACSTDDVESSGASMVSNDLAVAVAAFLDDAFLGREVDVDDAEPLRVALGPLEIVQQRPDKIAADVGPLRDRGGDRVDVIFDVGGAARVADYAVVGAGSLNAAPFSVTKSGPKS